MRRMSVRMFVMLVAMAACVVTCHWMAWAAPANATTCPVISPVDEPNDPQPGPEILALAWSDDDPNGPEDPTPGPECI